MPKASETQIAVITTKRLELKKLFDDNKNDKGESTLNADQLIEVKTRNDELGTLFGTYTATKTREDIEEKNNAAIDEANTPVVPGMTFKGQPGNDGAQQPQRPDIGKMFVEAKSFKGRVKSSPFGVSLPQIETKTLFSTTAGWDPFVTRLPRVALSPQQLPRIVEAFPTGTTNQHSIKFMLETLYTNAAAETAEGALYPESALKLTEQIQAVVKLAAFLPVTDEQLEDEEQARDYINARLDLQLKQRLDSQLVNGDGTGSNLLGIANITGINTRALAAGDTSIDTVLKSMVDVETIGFSTPTAVLFNPTNWMNIRLLRTTDGLYIWGHPSMAGPVTLWGLPVVASTFITAGTGYVADFLGQLMLFYRRGIEFLVSNSHLDFFARGQQAIRADMRCALVCFRPKAITKMTALT